MQTLTKRTKKKISKIIKKNYYPNSRNFYRIYYKVEIIKFILKFTMKLSQMSILVSERIVTSRACTLERKFESLRTGIITKRSGKCFFALRSVWSTLGFEICKDCSFRIPYLHLQKRSASEFNRRNKCHPLFFNVQRKKWAQKNKINNNFKLKWKSIYLYTLF